MPVAVLNPAVNVCCNVCCQILFERQPLENDLGRSDGALNDNVMLNKNAILTGIQ